MKRTMRECVKRVSIALVVLMCCIGTALAKNKKEQESYNMRRASECIDNYDLENALLFLEREMDENPKNAQAFQLAGFMYYYNREPGCALSALHKSLQLIPKKDKEARALSLSLRGKVYLEMMLDTVAALPDLEEAYRLDTDDNSYAKDLSELYFDLERYEEADVIYKAMASRDPGDPYPLYGLARNATEREDYEKALSITDKAMRLNPASTIPYLLQMRVYRKTHEYQKALDSAITVLKMDQDDDEALDAVLEFSDSVYNHSVSALKRAAVEDRDNAAFWNIVRGMVHENKKDYEKAFSAYELAAADPQLDLVARDLMISCAFTSGDYIRGEALVTEYLNIQPEDAYKMLQRGKMRFHLGKYDKAREDYLLCMETDPDYDSSCYVLLGWLEEVLNNTDSALYDYDMAIMLDDSQNAKLRKALLLAKDPEYIDEARSIAQEIFDSLDEFDRMDSAIYPFVLYLLGRNDEAREEAIRLAENESPKETGLYNVACLACRMGDTQEALKYLRQALDLGYNDYYLMKNDLDLEVLHGMPEFEALFAEIQPMTQIITIEDEPVKTVTYTVPLVKQYGGTYLVKATVNGLSMDFILDTGCSDVSISQVECDFMLKNGYLKRSDFLGTQRFVDATGKVSASQVINIDSITIGDHEIKNIRAGVVPNQQAPLLLGMEVLNRFGRVEIDPVKNILTITVVEKE